MFIVVIWSPISETAALVTFCVSCRKPEMYSGHSHLCLSVCLCLAALPHYFTDLDVTWGNGTGCTLVMHYWSDLQSVHTFRCYYNIHIYICMYTAIAYRAEREMSPSACTHAMPGCFICVIVLLTNLLIISFQLLSCKCLFNWFMAK